ncbi:MAG: hypothetical protein QHJ73_10625, partial [Armatimonadota bacterium]|nr:hypothetical protein [Armatimonadota bacterium]
MMLRWVVLVALASITWCAGGLAEQGKETAPAAATAPAATPGASAAELQVRATEGGSKVTVVAVEADAKAVLEAMAKESGKEIRAEPAPQAKVTLSLSDESFERALLAVAARIGYRASRAYVISPKKEGQELPDALSLPMGLPTVSLKLPNAVPVAQAVAALRNSTQATIELQAGVTGEAKIEAENAPLSEVLDDLCRQVNAVWALSY